jgi:hypothetical protein
MKRLTFILLALLLVLGMPMVAAGAAGGATKTISAKALDDHECDDT